MWKTVLLAGFCVGLCACASMGGKNVDLATTQGNVIDVEKIDKVTQWAHDHGATVLWIHYPVRPVPRTTPAGG
jgi:hypothetical protein